MAASGRSRHAIGLLLLLAWIGAVLWRFQSVHSPEPVLAIALLVAWLLLFTCAAAGYGRGMWRLVAARASQSWEEGLLVLALGATGLVGAGLVLAAVGLLRPVPVLLVFFVGAAFGVARLPKLTLPPHRLLHPALLPLAAVVMAVAVFTLLTVPTLSPFYDQLHYHLAFPYQWLRTGHLVTFPRQAYSFMPAAMGVLYTYALAALGPWAAQAVHWWTGALAVATAGAIAFRLGGPRAGWASAAVLAATPAVIEVSTWAAADLGASAFGLAAWLMILLAVEEREARPRQAWWVAVGALAGMAAAAKVLALATVVLPLLVGVVLLGREATRVRVMRRVVLVVLGCVLVFSPWAGRNLVRTGNPLYPFGSRLVGLVTGSANHGDAALARAIAAPESAGLDVPALVTLATFKPMGEAGSVGPVYLALLPLVAWAVARDRRRFVRVLGIVVVVGVLGWGVAPLRARFLLPVLGPLAVLTGLAWQRLRLRVPVRARPVMTSLVVFMLAWSAATSAWSLGLRRLACTVGVASGDEVMRDYASYWPATRLVNERLPRNAKILLVGESRTLNIDRDVVVEDPFHTPLLVELATAAASAQEIAAKLRAMGVTHVLINWHEAKRIAEMNGWPDYFSPAPPPVRQRLDAFLSTCLQPVFRQGPVDVFALRECP